LFALTVPLSVALIDPIAVAVPVVATGDPAAAAIAGVARGIAKTARTTVTLNPPMPYDLLLRYVAFNPW
jgi:hypothetical protein